MMLSTRSLIRRYTPPTCTLEIWAKRSPLSRWTTRPLVKEVRFELRFDDPRVPIEEQITIQGNRPQLELLSDVVTNYVQKFLQPSFGGSLFNLAPEPLSNTPIPSSNGSKSLALSPTNQAEQNQHLIAASPSSPFLKASGLLSHELFFGSLATEASGSMIKMSVSQLFDLANALEEYRAEVTTLPALNASTRRQVFPLPTSTAASVLLAVGLTAVGMHWVYQSNQSSRSDVNLEKAGSQPSQSTSGDVVPPVPLAPTLVPSPNLPPALSSKGTLPTPSAVKISPPPIRSVTVPQKVAPILPPPPGNNLTRSQSPTLAIIPNLSKKPVAPTSVPTITAAKGTNSNPSQLPSLQPQSVPQLGQEAPYLPNAVAKTRTNTESSNTLLDVIPQVAEARKYFQQRWKAPEGLNQKLEYRLVLAQDGSIKRIIPLGQAAKIYLDRTNMPLLGEPFVSPVGDLATNPNIRLVLEQDGTVRTFLE